MRGSLFQRIETSYLAMALIIIVVMNVGSFSIGYLFGFLKNIQPTLATIETAAFADYVYTKLYAQSPLHVSPYPICRDYHVDNDVLSILAKTEITEFDEDTTHNNNENERESDARRPLYVNSLVHSYYNQKGLTL